MPDIMSKQRQERRKLMVYAKQQQKLWARGWQAKPPVLSVEGIITERSVRALQEKEAKEKRLNA